MKADIDLDIGRKTFASGLLPELIAALGRSRPGDLVAVVGDEESIGSELETWCRFTGNPLLEATVEKGRARWVFRMPLSLHRSRRLGGRGNPWRRASASGSGRFLFPPRPLAE